MDKTSITAYVIAFVPHEKPDSIDFGGCSQLCEWEAVYVWVEFATKQFWNVSPLVQLEFIYEWFRSQNAWAPSLVAWYQRKGNYSSTSMSNAVAGMLTGMAGNMLWR